MIKSILWFAAGAILAFTENCGAADPSVFRVLADDAKLTGFMMKGTDGIVTALHGVVGTHDQMGKTNIRAVSAANHDAFLELQVLKVDLQHDLALLSSPKLLAAAPGLGFAQLSPFAVNEGQELFVLGYPREIEFAELRTKVEVRKPALPPLQELVGPDTFQKLLKRASPDPLLNILSIQGDILPGHSGAPVLNSEQQVLAVANGGLLEGISWAIPVKDISWQEATAVDAKTLARLQEHSGLFSQSRVLSKPIELKEVSDKEGDTTAKASGKVSWLSPKEGIRVDFTLEVKKTGVNGKGYAYGKVDLLDAAGNTRWSTKVEHKHKGASVPKGVAKGEASFTAIAPAELRSEITSAVLTVKAVDGDGFSVDDKFFKNAAAEIMKSVRSGKPPADFQSFFPL